ncbi:MAG: response regulator [Candidatus Omnitrophota bacterium]
MSEELQKKKILIADDEERVVKILKALCENLGYETIEARDGKEAIDMTLKQIPDLVLMDVAMPQKDGFEATRILKGSAQTKHIPVLILSARYSREDILRGISIGTDDYLLKPIDLDELSLRIKNHLTIKEYHDLLVRHNEILEKQVEKRTKGLMRTLERLDKAHSKIKESYIDTIQKLSRAAEYKDEETGEHIKRIGLYTGIIAEKMVWLSGSGSLYVMLLLCTT